MRKLIPLAFAVVVAMAFMAPSASASAVEVEDRGTSAMCTPTNCNAHIVTADARLIVHIFFFETEYVCDVEFTAHIGAAGAVNSIGTASITDSGAETSGNCNELAPCELPWTGEVHERENMTQTGPEFMDSTVCVTGPTTCEGEVQTDLIKTGDNYSAELNDVEIEGDPSCEFDGDYVLEDPDGVEIHHVDQ